MAESSAIKSMGRSLLRNAVGLMGSRVTGLMRDMALSAFWGATGVFQAAYSTAFGLTNSLRGLFGEGAFATAFVPMISERLERDKSSEEAWRLANRAMTLQFVVLASLTVIGSAVAFLAWRCQFFSGNPVRSVACAIMPLVLPFALLICLSGALSGILNSLKVFLLPSAVQMIFNFFQMATVAYLALFWRNDDPTALIIFCLSTSLAGLTELLILLMACRRQGYRFVPDWHFLTPDVLVLCRKMVPSMIGAGLHQLNYFVDIFIGTLLGSVAVGALSYSQRLAYLPIGLFGAAMGMVCLPALSRAQARRDYPAIREAFDFSLQTVLFMALPATAFLFVCGNPLIALFFQHGAFTAHATSECTWALLFYMVGLPAICVGKVVTAPFHARLDTRTPMMISLLCIFLNLTLNLLLMRPLRQGGLALSTSICSWVSLLLLLALNKRHLPGWSPVVVGKAALLYAVAAALSGAGAWAVMRAVQHRLSDNLYGQMGIVAASFVAASAIYLSLLFLLRRRETMRLLRLFIPCRRRQERIQ